jgi:alpha-tubulin suppressor-like RCC1 family protein
MGLGGSTGLLGWGDNTYRQLEEAKVDLFSTPTELTSASPVIGLALGARHSCVLRNATPPVTCLGSLATAGIDLTKLPPIKEIAGGTDHVCGLASDGRIFCWGNGMLGQLGTGTSSPDALVEVILP